MRFTSLLIVLLSALGFVQAQDSPPPVRFEFKNGDRKGANAAQMAPTVEKLELEDMVALAAYVGSLYP